MDRSRDNSPGSTKDPVDNAADENRQLRRTVLDLLALSSLPATWTGLGPAGVGRGLAEALLGMLSADFVYVRFEGAANLSPIEVIRTRSDSTDSGTEKVRAAVASLSINANEAPLGAIPNPNGPGLLQVAVTRVGVGEDIGVLIAGSTRTDFPTEQDRTLLCVGANQTALVLERIRIQAEAEAHRERLHVTLKSIGDGVITSDHTLMIGRDGVERPIDSSVAPIRDKGGNIGGAVLIFRDLTERRNAEALLRSREARYRLLVTATSDVVYRMNAEWSEMQPLEGRDLVASNREPIRNWLETNIPESDYEPVREAIRNAIANETTFEIEHRVIRPDGSIGWTLSRAVPIRDASGQVVEWFGAARNVTEQRQAKEDLARVTADSEHQRRLYEAILSATPDFVYVFSLDYRVLYANAALSVMWGQSFADTIGKTFLEIGYEPWHAEMHCREIDQVRQTKQPIRGEVPFDGTHGRRIYDYIFVPVFGVDGEVEAVAGTTRDITERKQMEDELRHLAATLSEADHRKDEFLATLAHELRNPLAPIRNGLQILKLIQDDPEAAEQTRGIMERQVDQMVRLVDDLMDVSRISRGKIELREERLSLVDVLNSAVETSRPVIEKMGHELSVTLPSQPIVLNADLTRLAQVFSNLLNNAAKYSNPGGRIVVTAARKETDVVVSVKDTGIGIPPEQLPRIFELFSQLDHSLEKSQGGLGIGLTLVRRLVEMHGGGVEARSEGPGRGSEFIVRLPLAEETSMNRGPKDEEIKRVSLRILVVDDNRDGADTLSKMLKYLGNNTLTAYDGEDAVSAADLFRPDVILMDIGMPKLNGNEACRRIRQQRWEHRPIIIAQTGWGQDEDRQRTQDAGFDHHLVKPVDIAELIKLLPGDAGRT